MKQVFINKIRGTEKEDLEIINLLCSAFQSNVRMRALIGQRAADFTSALQVVIAYCYFMVKKLNGVFISQKRTALILYYKKSTYFATLSDVLHYLYMAVFVVGLGRLPKIYQREKRIKAIREKHISAKNDADYLYVWFLAQRCEERGISGLVEVKNHIIKKAKKSNLPIYMETTEERLLNIYRRIGFSFYDQILDEETKMKVWFGRFAIT